MILVFDSFAHRISGALDWSAEPAAGGPTDWSAEPAQSGWGAEAQGASGWE